MTIVTNGPRKALRKAARGVGAAVERLLTRLAEAAPHSEAETEALWKFPFF